MFRFSLLIVFILSTHTFAYSLFDESVIGFLGDPIKTISVSGVDVSVYPEAVVEIDAQEFDFFVTGAGIRKKKIGFLNFDVYIASSFITNPLGMDPDDPMSSIENSRAKFVQMTFVRDLTAEQMRDGFIDSLTANGIDIEDPAIKEILDQFTFDIQKGDVITILGYDNFEDPDWEHVYAETPEGVFVSEGENLATTFWKCWFGIPADQGLENLKKDLVSLP